MNLVQYIIRFKEQTKGIQNSQAQVEKLDRKVKQANKSISAGTVAAYAAAGIAVVSFVGKTLKAYDAQEKALAQVQAGLQSTAGVSGKTFDQLAKQAGELQGKTLFGDEDILQNATAQLLTFTNIAGQQFDRTIQASLDLATRLDGDLKSATIQLGKALNDPVANLSALSRSGIQFTKEQKEVINALVKTNRLADAQTIILDELQKQYGGAAAAAAAAGTGPLKQLSNRIGDLYEVIGQNILPVLNTFASVISWITGVAERNQAVFGTVIQILAVLAGIITTVVVAIKAWSVVQAVLNVLLTANPIGIIIVALGALIALIVAAYRNSETFRGILGGVQEVFTSIWNFLKAFVFPIFSAFIEKMKEVGKRVADFLQKPIQKAQEYFQKFIDFLEKIPGVGKLVKSIRENFKEGFRKGVEDFKKSQEKTSFAVTPGVGAGAGVGTAGLPGSSPGAKDPATVSSAAPKVFNINIDRLVEKFEIQTTNIQEGAGDIRKLVTQALLEAIADVQPR